MREGVQTRLSEEELRQQRERRERYEAEQAELRLYMQGVRDYCDKRDTEAAQYYVQHHNGDSPSIGEVALSAAE